VTAPRLGFAVKLLGRPELRSHDARRWQNWPHLQVSLEYVKEIISYLDQSEIRMYRLASGLAPYATHPDHPEFHRQVAQSRAQLFDLARHAPSLAELFGVPKSVSTIPVRAMVA
jgi:UV DNA damage endonuclease